MIYQEDLTFPAAKGSLSLPQVCLGHFRIPPPRPTPGWALLRMSQVTPPYSLYFSDPVTADSCEVRSSTIELAIDPPPKKSFSRWEVQSLVMGVQRMAP